MTKLNRECGCTPLRCLDPIPDPILDSVDSELVSAERPDSGGGPRYGARH
jgi:hypothetical protein